MKTVIGIVDKIKQLIIAEARFSSTLPHKLTTPFGLTSQLGVENPIPELRMTSKSTVVVAEQMDVIIIQIDLSLATDIERTLTIWKQSRKS